MGNNNNISQKNKQQKINSCIKGKSSEDSRKKSTEQDQIKNQKQSIMASEQYINQQQSHQMLGISLVIARNNQGKFLAVKENYDQGWWIPGGLVDPPEDFLTAAIRETKEEAGIDIEIKGILRIEQSFKKGSRYKVVFYGEPKDQNQIPKQIPDEETQEARWVTLTELVELGKKPPYLRGKELLHFGSYLENGGPIYPLNIIETLLVPQFFHKSLQNVQVEQIQEMKINKEQPVNKQTNINQQPHFNQKQEEQPFNVVMQNAPKNQMIGLSLIVVKNKQNKFLAVKEIGNRGWWLPGGKVDPPEDFITAGVREAKEEAGIDIEIKGVLRIEQDYNNSFFRYKVVFYAEPIDENQKPKQIADQESEEARWVTLDELRTLGKVKPFLRGTELLEFGDYLLKGGPIYPLDVLSATQIKV